MHPVLYLTRYPTPATTRSIDALARCSFAAFTGGCHLDSALRSSSSSDCSRPTPFQLQPRSWRRTAPAPATWSPRHPGPSAAFQSPAAAASKASDSPRVARCACHYHYRPPGGDYYENDRQRRRAGPLGCLHDDAVWRARRRPLPPSSLCAVKDGGRSSSSSGSASSRFLRGSPPPPGEAQELQELQEDGGGGEAAAARRRRRKKKEAKKEKSVFGKAGDALKSAFNVFMAASTVLSLALAAEALWQLHGTQLTLSNAVPTLTKLLPLTGIGVFGAAQLVGLVARVVRVIVTLPIMLSGTWVILQNAPKVRVFVTTAVYRGWVAGWVHGISFSFPPSFFALRLPSNRPFSCTVSEEGISRVAVVLFFFSQ